MNVIDAALNFRRNTLNQHLVIVLYVLTTNTNPICSSYSKIVPFCFALAIFAS